MERAANLPRFLMVYLHNPNHEATDTFVQQILSSPRMTELIDQRVVLYGSDVTTTEGFQLASRLMCTTYPFVAVFFKKQLVCRLQGEELVTPQFTFAQLDKGLGVWDHDLSREISQRMERERNALERIAEEAAETERMNRDRELLDAFEKKEAKRKSDAAAAKEAERALKRQREEEAAAQEQRRQEEEAEQTRAQEALQLAKSLALSSLPAPPPQNADPSLVLFVNLRLPKRAVERKFYASDSVESLYSFVETLDEFNGKPFTLMLSGMPPKRIPRRAEDGAAQALGDAVGGQRRVAIMFREG